MKIRPRKSKVTGGLSVIKMNGYQKACVYITDAKIEF